MIVAIRSPLYTKPVLEVVDSPDQVVVRFIGHDEHLTLHLEDDGTILHTHYFPDKPSSVWDATRVEVATHIGYQNPTRHGSYVDHRRLNLNDWPEGFMLLGRRVDLMSLNPKQRYFNQVDVTFDVEKDNSMLHFY